MNISHSSCTSIHCCHRHFAVGLCINRLFYLFFSFSLFQFYILLNSIEMYRFNYTYIQFACTIIVICPYFYKTHGMNICIYILHSTCSRLNRHLLVFVLLIYNQPFFFSLEFTYGLSSPSDHHILIECAHICLRK